MKGLHSGFIAASLCAALLTACTQKARDAAQDGSSLRTGRRSAAEQLVCQGSGAHDRHAAFDGGCALCHPCGGALGFSTITLPGGTTTAGGTFVPNGDATTCTVQCHYPFGGTPTQIAWNSPGPLPCTSCHNNVTPATPIVSKHPGDFASTSSRATCTACHDLSRHLSGTVQLVGGDGTTIASSCTNCHSGQGQMLGGETPPVLTGYTGSTAVDFHGDRAGSGYGGTLKAPYVRGNAALPCGTCHQPHASGNAFLLASTVNGTAIPGGRIDRAGVGAEVLCEACHQGDRHAACAVCHSGDPMPAGSPCFVCHGHEGIRIWPTAVMPRNMLTSGSQSQPQCAHCHSYWMPSLTYTALQITAGPTTTTTTNTATVIWDTDRSSTSYVEYGKTAPGKVLGSATLSKHHQVTISGLDQNATYVVRVYSSDGLRNTVTSSTQTFATANASAPSAPTLVSPVNTSLVNGNPDLTTLNATLNWNPVSAPDGHAVVYRVQVSATSDFAAPSFDAVVSTTSVTVTVPTEMATYLPVYWRVLARDSVDGYESLYSTASFVTYTIDPYDG